MSAFIPRPLVLCILDGWGLAEAGPGNAISQAATPTWTAIAASHAMTKLATSGEAVGLPCGQMGNSEVGHITMGAGRIIMQNLPRIDAAVRDGSLAGNPVLGDLAGALGRSGGVCHIAGLLSPGGVHSHQDHMAALANTLHDRGIDVLVHAFLDGRDTPPSSATSFLERFAAAAPHARIVTLTGRYYAMDRDRRWPRVKRAWAAMVKGDGAQFGTISEAMASARAAALTDEFVTPAVIGAYAGMRDGDGLIMANFRADRARQITGALIDPAFTGFDRDRRPQLAGCVGMVPYAAHLDRHLPAMFQSPEVNLEAGYETLKRATRGFQEVTSETVTPAVLSGAGGAAGVALHSGVSHRRSGRPTLRVIPELRSPKVRPPTIDRAVRISPDAPLAGEGSVTEQRIRALIASACHLMASGVPDGSS